jgi:hypothetical protein
VTTKTELDEWKRGSETVNSQLLKRIELLEAQLADAARLLKDAAPPWAGMTPAEAELVWEWSAARRKFVECVTGEKSCPSDAAEQALADSSATNRGGERG